MSIVRTWTSTWNADRFSGLFLQLAAIKCYYSWLRNWLGLPKCLTLAELDIGLIMAEWWRDIISPRLVRCPIHSGLAMTVMDHFICYILHSTWVKLAAHSHWHIRRWYGTPALPKPFWFRALRDVVALWFLHQSTVPSAHSKNQSQKKSWVWGKCPKMPPNIFNGSRWGKIDIEFGHLETS